MSASGLLITACEEVKKPIFSEVQVIGTGPFLTLTDKIGTDIAFDFAKRNYIVSMTDYNAITIMGKETKVAYCENKQDKKSESHEKFHVLMQKAKLKSKEFKDPAKGYLSMFHESAATAVEEYTLLKNHEGDKAIVESVNSKRKLGRDTYDFARRCLNLEDITKKEINEFANKSFIHHRTKNWASMLLDLTYLGFVDPMFSVLGKYGLDEGQQELIGLARTLKDDESAETFFKQLREKSGKAIERIPPIREGIVTKGMIEYKNCEDRLDIIFSGPAKKDGEYSWWFFKDTAEAVVAKHKNELESAGELQIQAWALNYLLLGRYE